VNGTRKAGAGLAALALGAILAGIGASGAEADAFGRASRGAWSLAQWEAARSEATHRLPLAADDDERSVPAGTLDDGEDLLPLATLTIDEAITAAQRAESGVIGEIDLEEYRGRLVFNVDVGDRDVKVDAETGDILGSIGDD